MRISSDRIQDHNRRRQESHEENLDHLAQALSRKKIDVSAAIEKIRALQVAIPSWALGAGGTRFGRFSIGGEPSNLSEKIEDVGLIHSLTQAAGSISLHIPWDIPEDYRATIAHAEEFGLTFDAVNSNTFQDQHDQVHSY